jgi:hypothetical protein
MTANKEPKQKHKRPEKHAQQRAELVQKKARLEKEKEAQLSAMGPTSHIGAQSSSQGAVD